MGAGLSVALFLAIPASAGAVTQTFNFTGAAQTFTVPAGVTSVTFQLDGAAGGSTGSGASSTAGGLGAEVTTTLSVTPGETFQINVGGAGATGAGGGAGGFNGGGTGGTGTAGGEAGGGGGGATDVRDGAFALADRILVAAGGAGAGGSLGASAGGAGGASGSDGSPGLQGGHAATSTAPGSGGGLCNPGCDGGTPTQDHGGPGSSSQGGGGGGGGAGLFGGGGGEGGTGTITPGAGAGGGGGSSLAAGGTLTDGVRSGNGQVVITYTTLTPTLSTDASPNTTIGHRVRDMATLSGGSAPTGTITFRTYGPGDDNCSHAPVFTSAKTVSGNGSYASDGFTPTKPGIYHWTARYSGDSNNAPVTKPCSSPKESNWVQKASPSLDTDASLTRAGRIIDTAKLSGGYNPSGGLAFKLYGPNDVNCSGTPVFTDRVRVSGNGGYQSRPYLPRAPGTYRFTATLPGDAKNRAAHSDCGAAGESVTVR